jgi:1-acyl-sn-glycerol-3-phosphate acyltransferase
MCRPRRGKRMCRPGRRTVIVSGCGHGCLPKPGTVPSVGWLVRGLRLAALLGVLGAGLGAAAAVPVLTRAGRRAMKRAWFRLLLHASGVRLIVRGEHRLSPGRGTLVVANHVSWLDIPAILAVEGLHVVAKADVRRWPVVGLLAARGGTLFIDRYRLRALPVAVADIATALRSGHSVLAFPESTTWCGRTQGRFYPATFQAAINAGAPVRPVCRCATGLPGQSAQAPRQPPRPRSSAMTPCSGRSCEWSRPAVWWLKYRSIPRSTE